MNTNWRDFATTAPVQLAREQHWSDFATAAPVQLAREQHWSDFATAAPVQLRRKNKREKRISAGEREALNKASDKYNDCWGEAKDDEEKELCRRVLEFENCLARNKQTEEECETESWKRWERRNKVKQTSKKPQRPTNKTAEGERPQRPSSKITKGKKESERKKSSLKKKEKKKKKKRR